MDDMSDYDFAAVSERDSSKLNDYGWSGPPKRDKNKGDYYKSFSFKLNLAIAVLRFLEMSLNL